MASVNTPVPPVVAQGYQDKARVLVYKLVLELLDKSDERPLFSFNDVYVVWFSKTLQNWKALVSTNLPDGMYYEVTYNGEKRETYIDAYKKVKNVCVTDDVYLSGTDEG